MTPKELIDAFETLADAPDGVLRLRELVLQLAVQGKLVPQDADDEPASALLDRIGVERRRLIDEGVVPRPRNLDHLEVSPDLGFELPDGWSVARMDDIAIYAQRGKSPKYDDSSVIRVVSQKCVQWAGVDLSRARGLAPSALETYGPERFLQAGDLLWNSTGTGTVGRVNVMPEIKDAGMIVADSHVTVVRLGVMNPRFVYCWLAGPIVQAGIDDMTSGSTNQQELNLVRVRQQAVPVAPLAEQERIVSRVGELMALLDRLEAAQGSREASRKALRDAALSALRDAYDPEAVQSAWARIASQMDHLFADPTDVAPLRETVLELGVRGRLVTQSAEDEPAGNLLSDIAAEKARLVTEKKLKKSEPLPPVEPDEMPFALPDGWEWSRLGEMLLAVEAGWSPSAQKRPKEGSEWGVLKVSACSWGEFRPEENKALNSGTEPRVEHEVRQGDFLISRANTVDLVARSVVVRETPEHLMLSDKTLRLHPASRICVEFLNLANLSNSSREHYAACATGTSDSMRNVSQNAIRLVPIPVPPLAEQVRIVAKVDELMAMCASLESRLDQSRDARASFASSAVASFA